MSWKGGKERNRRSSDGGLGDGRDGATQLAGTARMDGRLTTRDGMRGSLRRLTVSRIGALEESRDWRMMCGRIPRLEEAKKKRWW